MQDKAQRVRGRQHPAGTTSRAAWCRCRPLNQPNEYEITYTVSFSVTAGDKELLPPQELSATRTYSSMSRCCSPRVTRRTYCAQDMARDLADMVMRRLSSL